MRKVLTMSFWKDPDFWIVVCVLGILWCIWYGTKGYGHDPKHARTEPERPLERTMLLAGEDEDDLRECAGCGDRVAYLSSRDLCDGCEWDEQEPGEPFASLPAVPGHEPPPVFPMPPDWPGPAPVPAPVFPSPPPEPEPVRAAPLEPLPPMAARTLSSLPRDFTGRHHKPWTPPQDADGLARLHAALMAWTPPARSLAELVQSAGPATAGPARRAPSASDESAELAFADVIALGDVAEYVRRTFAEAEANQAAVVADVLGSEDEPVPFDGASVAGQHDWDLLAPLKLTGPSGGSA
jgi:hypothetical protein